MNQAISISLGQSANHVTTHLYNTQESHIPYRKDAVINHHNSTFLTSSKSGTKTNYSPRALIYDLKGGLGALNKHGYHEKVPNLESHPSVRTYHDPPPKSEYQTSLDEGVKGAADWLDESTTQYWTDYNKLIYNPKSIFVLENYVHVEKEHGRHKNFANLRFGTYNVGCQEFKDNDVETQSDHFRMFLEQCDVFQGLNVVTDVDSAWGGYTSGLLEDIVDEYFNNSKHCVWIYGLMSGHGGRGGTLGVNQAISRIKTTIELSKNSSLFFPLNSSPVTADSSLISSSFNARSPWHTSSLNAMFINSLWGLHSQINDPVSMNHLESNLTRNFANRKFINEIKIHTESASTMSSVDINAYYQNVSLTTKKDYLDLSIPHIVADPKKFQSKYFVTNRVVPATSTEDYNREGVPSNVYKNHHLEDILKVDTFPHTILNNGRNTVYNTEFNVSTDFRNEMKSYRDIIKAVRQNNEAAMAILEDKDQLIEDISGLVEEYTIGYEDSDEESDDNY